LEKSPREGRNRLVGNFKRKKKAAPTCHLKKRHRKKGEGQRKNVGWGKRGGALHEKTGAQRRTTGRGCGGKRLANPSKKKRHCAGKQATRGRRKLDTARKTETPRPREWLGKKGGTDRSFRGGPYAQKQGRLRP